MVTNASGWEVCEDGLGLNVQQMALHCGFASLGPTRNVRVAQHEKRALRVVAGDKRRRLIIRRESTTMSEAAAESDYHEYDHARLRHNSRTRSLLVSAVFERQHDVT